MFRFRFLAPAILFDEPSEEGDAQQVTPGQVTPETPEAPAPADNAQPGPFDEKFDPTKLPEELRAGWNQLRADYTRKTQTVAEQRREAEGAIAFVQALQDPQTAPLALQALGVTIPGDDEPEGNLNPELGEDPLEQRVAAMEFAEQQRATQAQQIEQQQAIDSYVDTGLDELEQRTGRKFSDKQLDALEALAHRNLDEQGLPDVQAAFEFLFEGVLEDERKQWLDSKNSVTPPKGAPGSPEFDTSTPEGRARHMAAIAQGLMAADART